MNGADLVQMWVTYQPSVVIAHSHSPALLLSLERSNVLFLPDLKSLWPCRKVSVRDVKRSINKETVSCCGNIVDRILFYRLCEIKAAHMACVLLWIFPLTKSWVACSHRPPCWWKLPFHVSVAFLCKCMNCDTSPSSLPSFSFIPLSFPR